MERGPISFMEVEGVVWNELVIERHEAITKDLRHDGCARDDIAAAISTHERPAGGGKRRDRMPIHEQEIRRLREIFSGHPHRLKRGPKDVTFVDLLRTLNAEADLSMVQDDLEGPLTLGRRQSFGIVDVNRKRGGAEDDRRRNDRASPRTAARFVKAGDPSKARGTDDAIRRAE